MHGNPSREEYTCQALTCGTNSSSSSQQDGSHSLAKQYSKGVTIYYEREPWFEYHMSAQTADSLIQRAIRDMKELDSTRRSYQIIQLENFEKPIVNQQDVDNDDDVVDDSICVIQFNEDGATDIVRFSRMIQCYYKNTECVRDSSYVQRVIDYLCEKDSVFCDDTYKMKQVGSKANSVLWSW